ncbi:MAG: phosphomannomutase/phosphoglucomutase [Holosporales bacterium]|jgi:phosphomannomutase|nr:phosphomannomutase/phosphoglucomutase [Holosporales bacterium]
MAHGLDESIIRLYDIRGEFGKNLSCEDAFSVGKAFASVVKNVGGRCIAVARDGRLSSPELADALIEGIISCGVDVYFAGLAPTPALYFAVHSFQLDGGIMVTGSHNPKEHNGFKMLLGTRSFYGKDIKNLAGLIDSQSYFASYHIGQINEVNILDKYVNTIFDSLRFDKTMKIAWDCGNGAASVVIGKLSAKIPGQHLLINAHVDGNFPARSPDPTTLGSLCCLQREVIKNACNLGVAFDGDADRLVVLDDKGHIISGDQLLCLLARDVLSKKPGAKIIADVKTSDIFFDEIKRLGGIPLMSATGHSLIKAKISETGAVLAGELSGHMFFADEWYGFDDGLYSAARFISFLSRQDKALSAIFDELPKTFSSPEIRVPCPENDKSELLKKLSQELISDPELKVKVIDGLRVSNKHGWWLLRASNTQDAFVIRAEAKTQNDLTKLERHLRLTLTKLGIKRQRALFGIPGTPK